MEEAEDLLLVLALLVLGEHRVLAEHRVPAEHRAPVEHRAPAEHRVPAEHRALGEEEEVEAVIVIVIVPVIHHPRPHQYQSSPMFAICFHPALTRVWTVMVNIFIYLIVSAI